MTRVAIIDDESLAVRRLQIKLSKFKDIDIIAVGRDGDNAEAIIKQLKPDLLFLDIGMPGKDGLEVAKIAAKTNTHFIFTTAFQQYAVEAFAQNAVDYLLKPIDTHRLESAIERYRDVKKQDDALEKIEELEAIVTQLRHAQIDPSETKSPHFFWNQDNGNMLRVKFSDIEWVQASRDYILIHMEAGRTHLLRHTLSGFEDVLDPHMFLRVHRSSIINMVKVRQVKKKNGAMLLVTNSGSEIRVGGSYKQATILKLKELPDILKYV